MKLNLYLGHGEVEFDFNTHEERETFWKGLKENPTCAFDPQAACTKVGAHSIRIDPQKMVVGYRWKMEVI